MKAEEAEKLIETWLEENAVQSGDFWICKRCGERLMGRGERVSIHECYSLFGTHAGFGETTEVVIPYCPKCDGKPTIHIDCLDY